MFKINKQMHFSDFSLLADLPFATHRHERLHGDLYLPAQRNGAPVALVIHGGGWMNSDKSSLAPVCRLLARHGVAAFSVNYRRLPEAPWPACVEDTNAAFDFLHDPTFLAQHGLRAESLLVVGASAGAHLALMTALSRPAGQVRAILTIAPPVRVEPGIDCCLPFLFTPEFFTLFFGSTASPTRAQLDAISPLSLVHADSPPLWMVQSRNDQLVTPWHAEELKKAYDHHHRPVRLHTFNGPDIVHGLWMNNDAPERVLTTAANVAIETAVAEMLAAN